MATVKFPGRGKFTLYELDVAFPILPTIIIFLSWALLSWFLKAYNGVDFPGPVETLAALWGMITGKIVFDQTIYTHLYYSLGRFLIGLTTASAAGMTVGLVLGYSRGLREHLYPMVSILQPIPSLAWIPVAILLFGLGDFSTIFIIFMASIWSVIVNTVAGAESVPENYIRVAHMFRMQRIEIFTKIVIPHSIPYLINGLRISVANSWRALVAAEMIATTGTGLGYVIIQSRWNLDYTTALACIVIIAIIGYLMEKVLFQRLEYATLRKWGMTT
jgi:ABC-type nitrate/sulfonate/bicarbonate transport system permease component